jgi:hypothetical protein
MQVNSDVSGVIVHAELFRQLSGFAGQLLPLADGNLVLPANFGHEVSRPVFVDAESHGSRQRHLGGGRR